MPFALQCVCCGTAVGADGIDEALRAGLVFSYHLYFPEPHLAMYLAVEKWYVEVVWSDDQTLNTGLLLSNLIMSLFLFACLLACCCACCWRYWYLPMTILSLRTISISKTRTASKEKKERMADMYVSESTNTTLCPLVQTTTRTTRTTQQLVG
jgi:hypothetical protein